MNSRARYPPGLAAGRGGNFNPNYQNRNYNNNNNQRQQQVQNYGQRNGNNNMQLQQQQQYQQQQWLRRNQVGADSSNQEVEKTVQSEAVDFGYAFLSMLWNFVV